jgi:hypothetical protein
VRFRAPLQSKAMLLTKLLLLLTNATLCIVIIGIDFRSVRGEEESFAFGDDATPTAIAVQN